jgi:glycosyltransferase involved in cell wall biosynthesis
MKISIVTPSFRGSDWLKLCIASVADQEGVDVEHIVQDACSDDGTLDWLPADPRVTAYVEKDNGMYDAVNRGWKRSTGDIVAYLNCDEQYLPGALKAVHDYFEANPDVDVVVADAVITDSNGDYICHRYGLEPVRNFVWVRFSILTCSLFLRRRVLDEHNLYFDTQWRDLGDAAWFVEAAERRLRFGELRRFTSVFADTGENMNLKPNATREKQVHRDRAPGWVKKLEPLIAWHQRFRFIGAGAFNKTPYNYSIYTASSPDNRVVKTAKHPTAIWKGRSPLPAALT